MRFKIEYNTGASCFCRYENFTDYEQAFNTIITCNKYGVAYTDSLIITEDE